MSEKTKAEVIAIREKIAQLVDHDPKKAAKILADWIEESSQEVSYKKAS